MKEVNKRQRLSVDEYASGIVRRDRTILSRAITLVESTLPSDNELAEAVIEKILPHTGNSLRIGITGVPGVGKSTFIEAFGQYLTTQSKTIAVLTIDPSSVRSKGSILGDKTRMEKLANNPDVFIRPSPTGNTLGGVNSRTRETLLLCEASGFDIIIVETVGVGQSETTLKGLVDFFLLLMLSGAGDELQGIKRGIMEMADAIAINKADGDNVRKSEIARREYQNALHLFPPTESGWIPKVVTCSAQTSQGIKEIMDIILEYEGQVKENGYFDHNRRQQNLEWMYETIHFHLEHTFFNRPGVKKMLPDLEQQVTSGAIPPITAARQLLGLVGKG